MPDPLGSAEQARQLVEEARGDLVRAWDSLLLASHPRQGLSAEGRANAREAIEHVRNALAYVHNTRADLPAGDAETRPAVEGERP